MADPTQPEPGQDFAALLDAFEKKQADGDKDKKGPQAPQVGDRVSAKIVGFGEETAFVDLGRKAEGSIPLSQLTDEVRDRILISSFDLATIERSKALDPALATGYLVFDMGQQPDAAAVAADGGHQAFHPWDPFVTPELLTECRDRGLIVNTWAVDDPARWMELAAWGVDGIVTVERASTALISLRALSDACGPCRRRSKLS